jgi:hypothetical protein
MNILDYVDSALEYADKYKDLIKIGGSAGKAYLDYKNQKELNELTEDAYKRYMQEQQAAGQEAQAAVDINLTPMEVTGIPTSKADVTDFTALAAKGGIIGLKNGGDPNAGITALRKKAPGVVKRMGFESGSNEDGVAIQEAEADTVTFGTYGGNISFPRKEGESEEMAILNGLFNNETLDEETKQSYYKILIPQVYKNGEISKKEYDAMIQEIIVNKAKGGIANLRKKYFKGSDPDDYDPYEGMSVMEIMKLEGYPTAVESEFEEEFGPSPFESKKNKIDGTIKIEDAVSETKEPMKMANFTFSKRILDEYNANVAEGYDGSIEDYIIEFYGEEYLDPTYAKGGIANLKNGGFPDLNKDGKVTKADVLKGRGVFNMGGGVMDLGGMEKDYRFNGGFVPIGEYEKKDDVPARLSKNEFVFTADAVRAAGGGSINKGAKRMYDTMKKLEAKPTAKRMTA